MVPPELIARASLAKTTEDWQSLAKELAPVFAGILSGEVKATAAQAALVKDVYNRAFGKPVATQTEKRVAAGVVVLPALDTGMRIMICPKCGFDLDKERAKVKNDESSLETERRATDSVSVIDS